ncbi:hypothetical protein [uncultured Amaricoccus sp.]|uniref:hypothetical protein n=1 Tax=uncultured Amaricoccus sp. TaxID=339341 RepID=UPI002621D5F4|nr:hypothetical protein [uncultured Amaricoccus sp.]
MHLEQYDRIRAAIAARGLTPEMETRIALFVGASKAVNLPFLWLAGMAPATSVAWQAINTQLFRESEALTLLLRVTRWTPDPMVYVLSSQLTAPLYAESLRLGWSDGAAQGEGIGLAALAFGHALLATVRLAPIIPAEEVPANPFAVALLRIEQENGRLLQTQIRLLKDGFAGMSLSDRESAIAEKAALVEATFSSFLDSLAA